MGGTIIKEYTSSLKYSLNLQYSEGTASVGLLLTSKFGTESSITSSTTRATVRQPAIEHGDAGGDGVASFPLACLRIHSYSMLVFTIKTGG